jgi:hypothetical protein
MSLGTRLEFDTAKADRLIAKYDAGDMVVLRAATRMVDRTMDKGIKIAHEELNRAVYSTAPSATYQRTMALYNAPQKQRTRQGTASGMIFMSAGKLRQINPDAKRFVYIRAVEFGHGGPWPYHARPYWRPTMIRIRAELHREAVLARAEMKKGLHT